MAQATFSCPFGAIHLEIAGGTAPMSAFAKRALIVTFPPVPLFTEAGHFGLLISFGGLSFDRASLYYRPTRAFFQQNLQAFAR